MKANEMMIGDLVLAYGKKTQIVWVGNIHKMAVRGFPYEFMDGEIEPIPLTPEILEKNGFKRDPIWHYCDKDLDDYSISVQLGYANRIEYVKIAEKGKDNVIPSERTKLYLTHIKYVHDLQHALRLCGITSEIII